MVPISSASADIVETTIKVGEIPMTGAINPVSTFACVTDTNSDTVSRIKVGK